MFILSLPVNGLFGMQRGFPGRLAMQNPHPPCAVSAFLLPSTAVSVPQAPCTRPQGGPPAPLFLRKLLWLVGEHIVLAWRSKGRPARSVLLFQVQNQQRFPLFMETIETVICPVLKKSFLAGHTCACTGLIIGAVFWVSSGSAEGDGMAEMGC